MTTWTNDAHHFWGEVDCDELFLLFDTSAHVNDGTPNVDEEEVIEHLTHCQLCGSSDVRVTGSGDGCELEI